MRSALTIIGTALLAAALAYSASTLVAMVTWRFNGLLHRRRARPPARPPISILKPLCGTEPGLYEQLRSFCLQDYPSFQIVFGIRSRDDPALGVALRLQEEFEHLEIDVVVDPTEHGGNRKSSNLINMLPRARYDVLGIADSDTIVTPDYLRTVVADLHDAKIGLVTSAYVSVPTRDLWSRLGAMYVNEWYMPSVLLTWLFGYRGYASGQTLCLRRSTLEAVGSFHALADCLADDYRLGERIRELGLRIALSPVRILVEQHEPTFEALEAHEMRWMRTLRVLRPRSFSMLFLSFSLPLAGLGLCLCLVGGGPTGGRLAALAPALFAGTVIVRLGLHFVYRLGHRERFVPDLGLLAMRDLLLCWVWLRTFFASRIAWRDHVFAIGADGVMRPDVPALTRDSP
ncbi:MAG TPA: bacteriohopanetetrol glucosamine biosynthesis glycosyltransferase HpnI [Steroidobacteraceae bacterium]|nr:bacteriohopanetetrol glucosamine biosynthesis glycosyltransferase HpnI [Steroidobacteraceae bacterium]